jgi:hypothetical protein
MHKQAAKNTALLLSAAVMVGLGVAFSIEFIPVKILLSLMGVGLMGYLVYVFYSIEKSRLESLESLNKTVDQ